MRGLLYLIVFLFATGCSFSNPHPLALDQAERQMQTDPGAALSTLNSLDVSGFSDSATMARWALLYSEAMVANRLAAPTDTIVNIAVDYYKFHNQAAELQKAMKLRQLLLTSNNHPDLATALYLQKEKEFFLYKERARRQLTTALSLLILLAALGAIIWMRQRLKLKCAQNDALMAEAGNLQCRLESKLSGLLESRFALIDSLCQTYYEAQGTKTERNAIVNKVKAEIEAVRAEALPEMEQTINDCRSNLLVDVKASYPEIKADDFQLLVYLAGGLSVRTICLLLNESVEVIYKRKSRLKARMKCAVAPSRPDIMGIF